MTTQAPLLHAPSYSYAHAESEVTPTPSRSDDLLEIYLRGGHGGSTCKALLTPRLLCSRSLAASSTSSRTCSAALAGVRLAAANCSSQSPPYGGTEAAHCSLMWSGNTVQCCHHADTQGSCSLERRSSVITSGLISASSRVSTHLGELHLLGCPAVVGLAAAEPRAEHRAAGKLESIRRLGWTRQYMAS